jgi:small subunit ribosomal protein S6
MEYELLFFTSVANGEERIGEIKREIEEIITERGGKISADFSDIGKRKFAHPIKKQTHGFFSFCRFTLEEKENIAEMNRRLSLNDKVMRHIIVRADEVGKPMREQNIREDRLETKMERNPAKKPSKAKPAPETKPKAEIKDLDEKLSEILDENPE